MFQNFTTWFGLVKRTLWVLGCLLMCMGIMMPFDSFGALTPGMISLSTNGYPLAVEQPSITTWSAFDSVQARNVCVRITNSGTQDMTVWLLDKQSVVGLFTVLPQHISAMCTKANKIELGCSGDSCESTWTVFDAP